MEKLKKYKMDYKTFNKGCLEEAKRLYKTANADQRYVLEKLFPELREREDEKIRKELISLVLKVMGREKDNLNDENYDKMLDWLEKQKPTNSYCQENCKGFQETGKCFADGECDAKKEAEQESADKVESKFHEGDWVVKGDTIAQILDIQEQYYVGLDINGKDFTSSRFLNDDKIHLWTIQDAKDGDVLAVEPIDDYQFPFIAIYENRGLNFFNSYCSMGFDGKFYEATTGHALDNVYPATKEQRDTLMKAMADAGWEFDFEKKELKKIVPKFHVGDWIISNKAHEDYRICKITDIKNGYYTIESIYGHKGYNHFNVFEESYKLWTIQDAKDGDVLVNGDEIVIFKKNTFNEKDLSGCMFVYCSLRNKRGYWYTIGSINPSNYVPATKKRRDLLFTKMKEEGYEWDAEKKELRKIEQEIVENSAKVSESSSEEKDMCEYKKGFECGKQRVLKYPEDFDLCKKSTWSEEDEHKLKDIIYFLDTAKSHYASTVELDACIDWLKSLKDRVQPKREWSKEYLRLFDSVVWHLRNSVNNGDTEHSAGQLEDWLKSLKTHNVMNN